MYGLCAVLASLAIGGFCWVSFSMPFLVKNLPTFIRGQRMLGAFSILGVALALTLCAAPFLGISWGRETFLGAQVPLMQMPDAYLVPIMLCGIVMFILVLTACLAYTEYFSAMKNTARVKAGRSLEKKLAAPLALVAGGTCFLMFVFAAL